MQEFIDFLLRHWMLSAAAVVLIIMLIGNEMTRGMQKFRDLSPAEFARAMGQETALLIDVRETDEYRGEHIKGARHLALGTLTGKLGELEKHKDKPVIVTDGTGMQATDSATALLKAGFEKVFVLKEGIAGWSGENLPLVRGK